MSAAAVKKGPNYWVGSFKFMDSLILTNAEIYKIYDLGNISCNIELKLLYRATRDNFTAAAFHSKCDGYLNTLSIDKASSGNVFGGFTTQSWTCCNCFRDDPLAYILSLRRNSPGFNTLADARRFNVLASWHATLANCNNGPIFECGVSDFSISDKSNANNNSYSIFGHHYQYPSGYAPESFNASYYLTGCILFPNGACYFSTSEIEVFQLFIKNPATATTITTTNTTRFIPIENTTSFV